MEKYNWKSDSELCVWLMDSAPTPKAITGPKFDPMYKFVIRRKNDTEIKNFVPEWGLKIVCSILDADASVVNYWYKQIYPTKKEGSKYGLDKT